MPHLSKGHGFDPANEPARLTIAVASAPRYAPRQANQSYRRYIESCRGRAAAERIMNHQA